MARLLPSDTLIATLRTLARRFGEDKLAQTAGSLTFTTIISLVPMLTVALAVFTAFPAFDHIQDKMHLQLTQSMLPEAISDKVYGYLAQFASKAKGLGLISVLFLIFTATSTMLTVDKALNSIWRTPRPRSLAQRILLYWAALTLGPIVLGASLAAMSVVASEHGGLIRQLPGGATLLMTLVSWSLMGAALAALYQFVPNTQVAWRDALIGGMVAAVLFNLAGRGLAWYFTQVPTYTAVYGTFATFPLFLLWMYISWIVVLFGAMIAAYLPALRVRAVPLDAYAGAEFLLTVRVLQELAGARSGTTGVEVMPLARRLHVDPLQLQQLLALLEGLGWVGRVVPLGRGATRWALLCDPQQTPLGPLIDAVLLNQDRAAQVSESLARMLSDEERSWTLSSVLDAAPEQFTDALSASPTTSPSLPSG